MKIIRLDVGDVIGLKKNHPCSANAFDFKVLTIGSDIKIRCMNCGREATVARVKLEKNIKTVNLERP